MLNSLLKKSDLLYFIYCDEVYQIGVNQIKKIDGILIVKLNTSFFRKTGHKSICYGLSNGYKLQSDGYEFFKSEKDAYNANNEKKRLVRLDSFAYYHNCHLKYMEMIKAEL